MRTLLGVPVAHGDRVVGNLYLADKAGGGAFSTEDERLLRLLAAHAAVVIENARLAEQVQTLAVVAERDRISKDLHDGVIQSIYAVNLELEDAAEDVESDPDGVRARLDLAIDRLGEVMKDLRRYILGLQPDGLAERPLAEALAAVLVEARAHTLVEPHLRIEGTGIDTLSPATAQQVLQIAREAVANVVWHAHASRIWLTLEVTDRELHLRVVDNGQGFDTCAPLPAGHYGLRNLHDRTRGLGGTLTVTSSPGRGAAVDVRAPLGVPAQEAVHV
jgi:signal transduction histidine kinase